MRSNKVSGFAKLARAEYSGARMYWQIQAPSPEDLTQLEALLLHTRGIEDHDNFFAPKHPNNFTLAELGFDTGRATQAVQVIQKACAEQADVLLFGDYDADGICATAVLWEGLKSIGCIARPFIPHREKHGYGLTVAALQEIIAAKKPDMIVTVDNAIVAHAAASYAQEQGITLVISDHHQPELDGHGQSLYPQAAGIFHTTALCGTTVAWVLARELGATTLEQSLDMCGLATISDQVPLKNANRSFATHGIKALQTTQRIGLQALFTQAAVKQKELDSYTIGFTIAPRINAMGRLAHGLDALRLLCTTNPERAATLARELGEMNVQRQDLTVDQFTEAIAQVSVQTTESIVIAHSTNFHEGVIGLIAGRLMEKYAKPALVMSISEKGIKGSARSVKGVNITELLRSVREELTEVGGHPMAGGFSLKHEKLEVFKTKMFAVARETIDQTLLLPSLQLECELPLNFVSGETCQLIDRFAPFGSENNKPIFGFRQLRIVGKQTLGKEQQHLKLLVEPVDFSADPIEALWWRHGTQNSDFTVGQTVDCAAMIECATWKGKTKFQLILKDVIPAGSIA